MAEAAQMSYETFLKCQGRVAERRGWLLMSGTFEGSLGWYPEMYAELMDPNNIYDGISLSLPSWSNTIIYPGGRNDPEILRLERIYQKVEGLFDERCGAIPVPPASLVFREFRNTIHVRPDAVFDPTLPVYLAVDPSSGGDPYAVLAVQFSDYPHDDTPKDAMDYCTIIDEYYETAVNTEDIITVLKNREWWKNVEGGAIDIEAPDEKKRWLKFGKVPLAAKKIQQFAGIRRLKSFLHYRKDPQTGLIVESPHIRINPKVRSLPFEFSNYKRKTTVGDATIVDKPPENQEDHSIKALWYLLIIRYGDVKSSFIQKVVQTWKKPRQI
jgi:hypothetical protein